MSRSWDLRISGATKLFVAALASFSLLTSAAVCPTNITLRLIDARSGKPLNGIHVYLTTWNGVFDPRTDTPQRTLVGGVTDNQGLAVFHLSEPFPEHVRFNVFSGVTWACGDTNQDVRPEEVLQAGLVRDYAPRCGKLKYHATAKPGEIVIFDKRLTRWDMIRREIP